MPVDGVACTWGVPRATAEPGRYSVGVTFPLRIVTVVYHPGPELAEFVASLRAATTLPYELVIVDNGGDADAVEGATLLRPAWNLGYGGGVNFGARGFAGDWLIAANPDVRLEPGAIDALIKEATRWPRGGAFGPAILTPEGDLYPSARAFPRLVAGAGHALLGNVWPGNPFSARYRDNADTSRAHAVDWLSGAFLLLRGDAFRSVNGFDSSYFMFFEDIQLGEDLAARGLQSVFVPAAHVVHDQGRSWRDQPAAMLRAHHRSAAHYLDGVYAKRWQAPLRAALHLGLRVRAALEVRAARRK